MAPHSSTLAWKIPWVEEPGRQQSMGSLRARRDWATSVSLFTFMHWRRKWQPTPGSLPGGSQGRGAWWAAIYGVAQSRTRLKRLSSSSSKTTQLVRSRARIIKTEMINILSYFQHLLYNKLCAKHFSCVKKNYPKLGNKAKWWSHVFMLEYCLIGPPKDLVSLLFQLQWN